VFAFLKKAFGKTNDVIKEAAGEKKKKIEKEEFEDILLEADVSYELIERLFEGLPETINRVQAFNSLISIFQYEARWIDPQEYDPFVEMIIGVNGAGKTTTIAKLGNLYKKEGHKVIFGAGDTFRAAAIEQLSRWAERLDIPIVATRQGHDPSAVVYDTIAKAVAKGYDRVIIDTAGRLHTQSNLSEELKKMVRVADKALAGTPHRKLLILDGTQGSSTVGRFWESECSGIRQRVRDHDLLHAVDLLEFVFSLRRFCVFRLESFDEAFQSLPFLLLIPFSGL